jgi:hypothetical protein
VVTRKTLERADGWTGGCSLTATSTSSSTNEVRSIRICTSQYFGTEQDHRTRKAAGDSPDFSSRIRQVYRAAGSRRIANL